MRSLSVRRRANVCRVSGGISFTYKCKLLREADKISMVNVWDYSKTWYHGSPLRLTVLSCGSTITQERNLARIFSHKPTLVSQAIDEHGQPLIKHTGVQSGFLYRIAEPIQPADVYPHPKTTMRVRQEWLTTRPLRVELIEQTSVVAHEILTAEEIAELYTRFARNAS